MNSIQWLHELAKKEYPSRKPTTEYTRDFLCKAGNPQDDFPSIHITGTNGKGSTAKILFEILKESGYKTGLYTSPHLVKFNERIRINDDLISDSEVSAIIKEYRLDKQIRLTYFEVMTAIAFLHFSRRKVDIAVVEVGLGGKYDATNVLSNVLACIFTPIDYDHKEFFGNKITDIAREKAGIIKKNAVVISALQKKPVNNIIKKQAVKNKCRLLILGRDFNYCKGMVDYSKWKQAFSYKDETNSYKNIELKLMGLHQLTNASLALAAAGVIGKKGFKIKSRNIYLALANVSWPARLQLIQTGKSKILIDGAHNTHGAGALSDMLKNTKPFKGEMTAAMSIMKEKNYEQMIALLHKYFKNVILYKSRNKRSLDTDILRKAWRKFLPDNKITECNSIKEILQKIPAEDILCVTGSLYFAGEVIEYLDRTSE